MEQSEAFGGMAKAVRAREAKCEGATLGYQGMRRGLGGTVG